MTFSDGLKMRTTRLGFGNSKHRHSREWDISRIYQIRCDPDDLRWFWMDVNGPITRSGHVVTLEGSQGRNCRRAGPH
jgi:hypothetical protein